MLRLVLIAGCVAIALASVQNAEGSCFVVERWSPYPTCYQPPDKELCNRGWGVFSDKEICCWRSFQRACGQEPTECYVVEDYNSKSCTKDKRFCLRGWGVFDSMETCCRASFDGGCKDHPEEECWIRDTLYTARKLCRKTQAMCSLSWMKKYKTEAECCAPYALYMRGCDDPPPTTCWLIESQNPRLCRKSEDTALCARNWGIFISEKDCCWASFGGECDKMHDEFEEPSVFAIQ
ncbi:hypothetical protein BSKO_10217 [Bryopsis sp. KO-2023]|nr:hypothetical protein BSKO_10217 [Bryopsis sp. KO-2023]